MEKPVKGKKRYVFPVSMSEYRRLVIQTEHRDDIVVVSPLEKDDIIEEANKEDAEDNN